MALAAASRHLAELQVTHQLLDAAAVRRLEPGLTDAVDAAILIPEHGYVAASAMTLALAEAAAARGATFSMQAVERVAGDDRSAVARPAPGRSRATAS